MTLWSEPERILLQNMEQLHAHDHHQSVTVTETSGHRISTNARTTREPWVRQQLTAPSRRLRGGRLFVASNSFVNHFDDARIHKIRAESDYGTAYGTDVLTYISSSSNTGGAHSGLSQSCELWLSAGDTCMLVHLTHKCSSPLPWKATLKHWLIIQLIYEILDRVLPSELMLSVVRVCVISWHINLIATWTPADLDLLTTVARKFAQVHNALCTLRWGVDHMTEGL